ncbi:MAG: XRE family transcriptional regulator [Thermobacillus sp. ZCTH02-B1]|uniref:helix-turn-helix domain-containing protein n=1 Tax=Thermobacillus sp. ZCTH02-B1 TaxID=1858795 RepID=UPI000B583E50|nr:helix-turn-helix transcriptional regulator [Thermobacillus sp. ZCTH02-B1]OUM95311.1 MAG: XRE family transcriptional regulator [Thermobacillus sp. ZCTH02-B1]
MIGERLRQLRKAKGMTQEQVAAYLNAAKSTVSQYENNVNEPDLKTLVKLADLFGVSVDYLFGREPAARADKTDRNGGNADKSRWPQLLKENLTEEEAEYLQESLAMYRKWKARRAKNKGEST